MQPTLMEHQLLIASAVVRSVAISLAALGAGWFVIRIVVTVRRARWARTHRWFGFTRSGVIVRVERLAADDSIGGYTPCGCSEQLTVPFSPVTRCSTISNERCGAHAPTRRRA